MPCTIDWNSLTISEWEQRFSTIKQAPLPQSYAYARAVCGINGQKGRWGLIKIDGSEAGLVQVLEAGIGGNAVHGVIIDRGPVWFEGWGTPQHFEAFLEEITKMFPRRFGRRRRLIPEIQDNSNIQEVILRQGFKKKNIPGYQTIWLGLEKDEETLLGSLNSKWRGKLNKSRRAGLSLQWDEGQRHLPEILTGYILDKKERGYPGPSVKMLRALGKAFDNNMLTGRAFKGGELCAAMMILCHGASATYQVGWTTKEGRDSAAHHLLLWEAMNVLKQKGIKDFDLGGVNDESAAGVKQFKSGMGGELVVLPGLFT